MVIQWIIKSFFWNIQGCHTLRLLWPLMITQVSLKYKFFFEILRLFQVFVKNLAGFYFYFDEAVTQIVLSIHYNKLINNHY